VLLGLCLAGGKLPVLDTAAHKSIGSDGYNLNERAVSL